jgi:2-haloacid dehalogenase
MAEFWHPTGIYRHLLATMKADPPATLLVSSNPFDIIGGGAAELRTAWCRRQPSALFDPWGSPPDHHVTGPAALADLLSR